MSIILAYIVVRHERKTLKMLTQEYVDHPRLHCCATREEDIEDVDTRVCRSSSLTLLCDTRGRETCCRTGDLLATRKELHVKSGQKTSHHDLRVQSGFARN